MRRDLPAGTVTFLFTDIEGSTKLLRELGPDSFGQALIAHREVVRGAVAQNGGVEVDNQGDAFFFAFPTAPGALRAARAAQDGLAAGPIRVRMGIHTGTPHMGTEGYIGEDVHKGARIAAAGHGGQVLVSATTAALAVDGDLRDLGEHRLKDLSARERIHQLGHADFPPLRSLHQTNLPVAPTPFLGREREIGELVAMISGDGGRVVTLTGPGGTGKTRLGMQAAAELSERYPQGVWWVPLEALRQPDLVLDAAANALGAKSSLAEHIGGRTMLILFDNFEHVMAAARPVAELLASCPKLEILVTSREALQIRGEREYAVPPLAHAEAIRLFVERAARSGRAVAADGDVSEICRRLDDLPLAVELAAARAKVLSPAQIAARLEQRLPLLTSGTRDVPERQRTLRGAIEWSHELLGPEEQRLFAHLAVFRGGWSLEAAEAICSADLDVLQSLVEKSLVRREGDRFSMLETIREFAMERLEASEEAAALRRRHADHFRALAEEHEAVLMGGDPRTALEALERDHDNLREAIEHLSLAEDTETAMRLAGTLFEFWCLRGYARDGWARLEHLLAADGRPSVGRAKALVGSAHLAHKAGADRSVSRRRAEEALELNTALGRARDAAVARDALAGHLVVEGRPALAIPLYEESNAAFRAAGEEHLELQGMRSLAWAYGNLGDPAKYREIVEEVLKRARAGGDKRMHFTSLGALAWVATQDGRLRDALAMLREAYGIDRETLPRSDIALILTRLALLYAVWGKPEQAAVLLGRSEALGEETGEADPEWVAGFKERVRASIAAGLDEAAASRADERGRGMTVEQAAELAFAPLEEPGPTS